MMQKLPVLARLFVFLSACVIAASGAFASESDSGSRRPNFIHIMVDDMAADAMGFCGRFPTIETPNLDHLAESGIVFNQFFVTTSLCSPSRASILTGRFGHGTGVPDNSVYRDPNPAHPTYPALLQEAGYVTAHIGKWHQGRGDQPRPGFTHWYGFDGQGVYFDPVMNRDGVREEVSGYITDILTDDAVAFIEANRDRPFALNLWHKAAHGPFQPAPRHEGNIKHQDFPKHPTWDHDLHGKANWLRRGRAYGGVHLKTWLESEGKPIPEAISSKPFNETNTEKFRKHLEAIFAVDDSVGRIMQTLEHCGLLDNTVVVFTADNGFFLGEFSRGDKRLPDEASIRVPMILHYPPLKREGEKVDAIGLNIDFAPTFLQWAGVEVPSSMHGISLVPLLRGEEEKVRDRFLYEYFQEEYAPGIPTMLAVRDSRWKYIQYPYDASEKDELYDLKNDPMELHSLADDSRYSEKVKEMKAALAEEMERYDYQKPRYQYDPANYK